MGAFFLLLKKGEKVKGERLKKVVVLTSFPLLPFLFNLPLDL